MQFVFGLGVWWAIGLATGFAMRVVYRAEATTGVLSLLFGGFGAFIGGMLGTSPYIHHDPVPLRFGGLTGAVLGAILFTFLYHFTARKAI